MKKCDRDLLERCRAARAYLEGRNNNRDEINFAGMALFHPEYSPEEIRKLFDMK